MKYDFEANKTMKRLAKCHPIYKGSPEGNELEELFEGMGLELDSDNIMLAMFAYMLGRSRKNRKEVTRA